MEIKPLNYQTETGFTLYQKNKNHANLEGIAEEFEAMFINQMLKQARDSKLSEARSILNLGNTTLSRAYLCKPGFTTFIPISIYISDVLSCYR